MSSSSSSVPEAAKSTGVQLTRDAEVLIETFLLQSSPLSPPSYSPQAYDLSLPVCVPQLTSGFDTPFSRGYNHSLASSVGISQEEFLNFIDGLNMALIASPPLRVVDLTGMALGFVPYHWAIIASIGIQTIAKTGQHILSKTLSDRYLRAANARLFGPKGLSVRICTTPAMQHLLSGISETKSTGREKLDQAGRVAGSVLLRLPIPLSSRIVRAIADPAPRIMSSAPGDGANELLARRMALVNGKALPLDFEVPPPKAPEGMMETMNSWAVKLTGYKEKRAANRDDTNRRKYEAALQDAESGGGERQARRVARRAERGPGLIGSILGSKESRAERNAKNADLRELWKTNRLLWIVVMKSEKDREIEGIYLADRPEDVENISDENWRRVIAHEREEEEDNVYSSFDEEDAQRH